jgi:beta-hydroxylase
MFHSAAEYPFTRLLEDNWRVVIDEYREIAQRMHEWPEKQYYTGNWDAFGLYAFGLKLEANCALCPRTTELLERIPGMVLAGFSRLAPGTHIEPHEGYAGWSRYVLRCHLGLIVNDRCSLRVGDETRQWQAGKVLVFCDATEHEAWNLGDHERVILLLDFRNPEFRRRLLNPHLTPEIVRYMRDQWHDMSLAEKAQYWAWRAQRRLQARERALHKRDE